jgi:hypothetical protein
MTTRLAGEGGWQGTKLRALIVLLELETNFHEKRNHGLHLLVAFTTNDALPE